MNIEEMTSPRVFKFWFDVSSNCVQTNATGVIKHFLTAVMRDNHLELWAETIPSCVRSVVKCMLVSTGEEVPDEYQYVSSVTTEADFVYHIYAKSEIVK